MTFAILHRYLGVGVGEHLGYLLTGAWTILVAASIVTTTAIPAWLGWIGVLDRARADRRVGGVRRAQRARRLAARRDRRPDRLRRVVGLADRARGVAAPVARGSPGGACRLGGEEARPMTEGHAGIVIARPMADVFAVLTDAEKTPAWSASAVEERWLTPPPVGVGSRRLAVTRGMGRTSQNVAEVTAYEPGRSWTMTSVSGPRFVATADFATVDAGHPGRLHVDVRAHRRAAAHRARVPAGVHEPVRAGPGPPEVDDGERSPVGLARPAAAVRRPVDRATAAGDA